jgi:hypothetical protein
MISVVLMNFVILIVIIQNVVTPLLLINCVIGTCLKAFNNSQLLIFRDLVSIIIGPTKNCCPISQIILSYNNLGRNKIKLKTLVKKC